MGGIFIMEKKINTILIIVTFLIMMIIPNIVIAEEYEIDFHWQHSGTGMDKFVFSPSPTNAGPWIDTYTVMKSDLTPTVVDGKNTWTCTITVNDKNKSDIQWWVCYAESSWGKKSEYSVAAQSVYTPDPPSAFKQINKVVKQKVSVSFI